MKQPTHSRVVASPPKRVPSPTENHSSKYNGVPAGRFALSLVLGMYSRRKGSKNAKGDGELEEGEIAPPASETAAEM